MILADSFRMLVKKMYDAMFSHTGAKIYGILQYETLRNSEKLLHLHKELPAAKSESRIDFIASLNNEKLLLYEAILAILSK